MYNGTIVISVRIGKKSKDGESKSQTIEAINRLICTSKSQNQYLKGKFCHCWISLCNTLIWFEK